MIGPTSTAVHHDCKQSQGAGSLQDDVGCKSVLDTTQNIDEEPQTPDAERNNPQTKDQTLHPLLQQVNLQEHQLITVNQQLQSIKQEAEELNRRQNEILQIVHMKKGLMEIDIEEMYSRAPEFVEKIKLLEEFIQRIDTNSETLKSKKERRSEEERSHAPLHHHDPQYRTCVEMPGAQEAGGLGCDDQSFQYHTEELDIARETKKNSYLHTHKMRKQDIIEIKNQMVRVMHRVDEFNRRLPKCRQVTESLEHRLVKLKSMSNEVTESITKLPQAFGTDRVDILRSQIMKLVNAKNLIPNVQSTRLAATAEGLDNMIKTCLTSLTTSNAQLSDTINPCITHINTVRVCLSHWAASLEEEEKAQHKIIRDIQDLDEEAQNLIGVLQHEGQYLQLVGGK